MGNQVTILSTKKLSASQKELLLNAGLGFVEYDAIKIELLKAEIPENVDNAIFTSKNAVKAVFDSETNISNCFCVGENTKRLLEKNGQKVVETAQNASDLAQILIKKYKKETFLFFCGNLRRNELPELLTKNEVRFKEQIVYKTHSNSKKFDRPFEGILFFSPSGVQSFVLDNNIDNSIAFCIGNTTASEAKKHTNNVIIANKPTVENVIVQAVKYFKNDLSSRT
ncbi:uroporphyrinogen-III synthase [Aquimarina gracilis]|uniref:Uroporphyrinogen-III synthase n=1 Tax=Aquimarina gracilis TaxID=874422 RepID=A0ABU5ZZF6_9FLAO|nr:uroporphyrinogen-III synthase [Aquimarina gracilis]MEB3347195.1 uroporphyrinogen-III synthase [Aquimarina gracilis]